jgi:hypothetical protein
MDALQQGVGQPRPRLTIGAGGRGDRDLVTQRPTGLGFLRTASRQAELGESTWARNVQKVTKGLKSRWRLARPFA